MSATYTDGTFTSAFVVGPALYESPFPHTSDQYILRQKWCIAKASKSALALNTAHGDDSNFKLVAEGAEEMLGEGIVEWERVYAKVPDTFTEPIGTIGYQFIGLNGSFGLGQTAPDGRERFTRIVPAIRINTFYLVGTGGTYSDATDIPLPEVTQYYYGDAGFPVDYLTDTATGVTATVPSAADYRALIAADAGTVDSYSLTVEASIERWLGNIWWAKETKVKAL